MNHQDISQPVLQNARMKTGKIWAITLAIVLPVLLCGSLCVGAPTWLVYQWNRGIYYGYVTVDDPKMTYTQNVGDTIAFGSLHFQMSSLQLVKDQGSTFLVVHVRMREATISLQDLPGKLVVYTSPVFDASSNSHAFTGNEIDPVGDNAPLPAQYVFSRIREYDENSGFLMKSSSLEGDVLFKLPSPNAPFVLVLIPPESSTQYAWNSKIDDCRFL